MLKAGKDSPGIGSLVMLAMLTRLSSLLETPTGHGLLQMTTLLPEAQSYLLHGKFHNMRMANEVLEIIFLKIRN